jgi:chemotaxis protein MotD
MNIGPKMVRPTESPLREPGKDALLKDDALVNENMPDNDFQQLVEARSMRLHPKMRAPSPTDERAKERDTETPLEREFAKAPDTQTTVFQPPMRALEQLLQELPRLVEDSAPAESPTIRASLVPSLAGKAIVEADEMPVQPEIGVVAVGGSDAKVRQFASERSVARDVPPSDGQAVEPQIPAPAEPAVREDQPLPLAGPQEQPDEKQALQERPAQADLKPASPLGMTAPAQLAGQEPVKGAVPPSPPPPAGIGQDIRILKLDVLSERITGPSKTLVLQLQPVELGTVVARMRLGPEGLHIHITADSADAAAHLARDHEGLVKALHDSALSDESVAVTISISDRSGTASTFHGGQSPMTGNGQADGRAGGQAHAGFGGSEKNEASAKRQWEEAAPNAKARQVVGDAQEPGSSRGIVV